MPWAPVPPRPIKPPPSEGILDFFFGGAFLPKAAGAGGAALRAAAFFFGGAFFAILFCEAPIRRSVSVHCFSPQDVHALRNDLKVVGVNATMDSAQMVGDHPRRDRPIHPFPNPTMRSKFFLVPKRTYVKSPITFVAFPAGPKHASVLRKNRVFEYDLAPKTFVYVLGHFFFL